MSSRICNQCGCTDIDIDSARGDAVCTGCGSVLEDQIIISEVQFQENSGGGSSLIGQFVSSEGQKSFSIGGGFTHGMQKESRTVTLQNGKRRIQQLASQMNLNQHCVDTAFNFFKMAVSKQMTRGRKHTHVIAACLYLTCRAEKTPHMLLDFSDVLQVNVYTLGRTYLHLAKELCINLPDVDPCLYISRFAHALEFGDKTHEVSMTAMRLTQRMKRDWMSTGRRPSGLCGAALLVAARIHDFSRSVKEVIKVVKVCHATLKKRLIEFEETPSSQLTIEEFQTIDLEEEQDPPCFTEGKRRAKKLQEQSKLPDMTEEVSKLQKEIEKTLAEQKPRGPWAAYAKMADDSTSVDSDLSRLSDVFDGESSVDSGRTSSIDSSPLIHHSKTDMKHVDYSPCKNDIGELSWNSKEEKVTLSNTSSNEDERDLFKTKQLKNDEITQELVIGSNVLDSLEIGSLKKDKAGVACLKLAVQDIVSDCIGEDGENSRCATDEGNEELDLTGIDDDELDYFLLSEKEVLVKTKIWMTENEDYLEEQRIKEEKRRKEEEEEAKKPPEKRKKKHVRKKRTPMPEAATPQEAIQRILQEKRISCKINYDVLNDLNVKSATIKTDMVKPTSSFLQDIDNIKPVSRIRSSVSFDLSHEKQPPSKKLKTEKQELPPMLPQAKEEREPEVVVESGPVQYEQKDDGYGDEEDADGYDDDEEHHLSAAQLLGHTVSMEDEYGYDMD